MDHTRADYTLEKSDQDPSNCRCLSGYPLALAAITGGCVTVGGVGTTSLQVLTLLMKLAVFLVTIWIYDFVFSAGGRQVL